MVKNLKTVFPEANLPEHLDIVVSKLSINKATRHLKIALTVPESNKKLDEIKEILSSVYKLNYVTFEEPTEQIPIDKEPAASKANKPIQAKFRSSKKVIIPGADMLYGKNINTEFVPISNIISDGGLVACKGEIFAKELKELRDGLKLLTFDITDFENSISVKLFLRNLPEDDLAKLTGELKKGVNVAVQGTAAYDQFSRDNVITANAIAVIEKKLRQDTAAQKRVELHMHTNMSSYDAIDNATNIVGTAARFGHPAIAITDHGVVQAFPEAAKAGKENGVKILYGLEGYLVDDSVNIVSGTDKSCSHSASLDSSFVVFDIETTGLSATKNKITEIGAVKVENGKITDRWSSFINPLTPIPAEIVKLTGITDDMVKDAPTIDKALPEFLAFSDNSVLVAHNASFDTGFIKAACQENHLDFKFTYLDTLSLARALYPALQNHKLDTLCKHLNVKLNGHHRAVNDAEATAEAMIKMFADVKEQGIENISEFNLKLSANIQVKKYKPYHIILLAKNRIGLRHMYELVSASHLEHFYRTPRIPKSLLEKKREGLILGSACEAGQIYEAILNDASPDTLDSLASFYDYLEIQPVSNNEFMLRNGTVGSVEDLQNINKRIVELGKKHNKPVVATCDAHYIEKHSSAYRRILMSYKGFEDAEHQPPLYFRTTDEMLEEFAYLGEDVAYEVVVKNTNLIANMTEEFQPVPKEKYPPKIPGAEDVIIKDSLDRAKSIYGDPLPDIVQQRLDKELHSITTYGFAVMYRIAQQLVQKSRQDGYVVGSRGSVGSSLVAYLSGITEVNSLPAHYICPNCKHFELADDNGEGISGYDLPEKKCPDCGHDLNRDGHDIPFETFLGFAGDKEPDIDLNFSGDYQPKAHKYTEELFGAGHVFRAGTIGTVAEKTAYGYVKKYMEQSGKVLNEAEKRRLALGCVDVKRTTGQHPGGIIVVPHENDIHEFCPVQRPADKQDIDIITTHFDYHSIDKNLLKLDILGHDDPTVIRMLQDITGINPADVPTGDEKTMSLFSSTEALGVTPEQINSKTGTYGIPEFGTKFVRQMLEDTMPTRFSELVKISGLSHGTDVWINNAQDLIKQGLTTLQNAICTRDDIMIYLISMGLEPKLSFTIMEKVRKGKGLNPDDEKAMSEHNVPQWYIDSCNKIKYMFPKAHAVAYVTMAYKIAYFKVHYPKAFYISYFSIRADDFDAELMAHGPQTAKKALNDILQKQKDHTASQKEENMISILELCIEMYARKISFDKIDLYKSHPTKFTETDTGILPPLSAMSGIAENAAISIADARKDGEFFSKEDFKTRTGVSKTVMESLENSGCMDALPDSSQMTLFDM